MTENELNNWKCSKALKQNSPNSKTTATTEEPHELETQLHLLTDDNEDSTVKAPIFPFVSRVKLSKWEWIKMIFGTIFIAPIRFTAMLILITTSVGLSYTVTMFRSLEQIQTEPLSMWRKAMKWLVGSCLMRAFYFFAGFQWITVIGKRATPHEAPILVAAPHSSFFDSLLAAQLGGPSLVARSETLNETFNGQLMKMVQAIFVSRLDRDSRATAVQLISERAQRIVNEEEGNWPQILMFPEGTTGNRCCLIKFKPGAFVPGLPIQPIVIRYPNKIDSTTWTFDGRSFSTILWHAITKMHSYCVIEFLPVYVPNEEEKQDAVLYANNVEKLMSRVLGIPTSDYFYEDGLAIQQFPKAKIVAKLNAVVKFRKAMGITNLVDINLMKKAAVNGLARMETSKENFLKELSIHVNQESQAAAEELFGLFEHDDFVEKAIPHEKGMMDKREYIVYAFLLNPHIPLSDVIVPVFILYSHARKLLMLAEFVEFLCGNFNLNIEIAQQIFTSPDIKPKDMIDPPAFTKKVKKRLTYIKLLALEAAGLLTEYPPKADREGEATGTSSRGKSD